MQHPTDHRGFMELALAEAALAPEHGDVPVGAVVVDPGGEVVASNHNRREERQDPTAHAEVLVLSEAARKAGSWRLLGYTLYVTLEPCSMCAGAAVSGRIKRIVYGAADPKAGAVWSPLQHSRRSASQPPVRDRGGGGRRPQRGASQVVLQFQERRQRLNPPL